MRAGKLRQNENCVIIYKLTGEQVDYSIMRKWSDRKRQLMRNTS